MEFCCSGDNKVRTLQNAISSILYSTPYCLLINLVMVSSVLIKMLPMFTFQLHF